MKGVHCYELFGGIALKNHAFSFFPFEIYFSAFNRIDVLENAYIEDDNSTLGGRITYRQYRRARKRLHRGQQFDSWRPDHLPTLSEDKISELSLLF